MMKYNSYISQWLVIYFIILHQVSDIYRQYKNKYKKNINKKWPLKLLKWSFDYYWILFTSWTGVWERYPGSTYNNRRRKHSITNEKSDQLYVKSVYSSEAKKYCRSDRELCRNWTEHLQEGRMHNCKGDLCLFCKEPHKKICWEYKMEPTIQNKIRLDKCDVYTAKETLGYKRRNPIFQRH